MKRNSLRRFASNRTAKKLFLAVIGMSFFLLPFAAYWNSQAAGTYSGRVFKDYNGNGVYNTAGDATNPAIDTGVADVIVTLYDSGGNTQGTDDTDSSGVFSISATGTGPYRVEFTDLPTNFSPSARSTDSVGGGTANDSGSTVQVVADGGAANINLALNVPEDYCQSNPDLCFNQYYNGDNNDTTAPRTNLWRVPYNTAQGEANNQIRVAYKDEIGSTWGLAYDKPAKRVYAAAFLKKTFGFGKRIGSNFVSDPATQTTSLFIDLAAATYNVPVGTIGDNAARGLGAPGTPTNDATAFPLVGKVGFGDLDVSDDGTKLYVVNLNDKKLYTIVKDADNNPATAPAAGDVTGVTIPNPGCANGEWRPFAVGKRRETLYVGGICDAATSQNRADLRAHVYSYDGSSFTTVLDFALGNFTKGSPQCSTGGWFAWTDTFPASCGSFGAPYGLIIDRPQPILSDIEFDNDGSMLIGFTDRMGHQQGAPNYSLSGTTMYYAVAGGDLLRAYNSSGTFVLESNGTAGSITTAGAGNNQGPGGGEFYLGDFNFHRENVEGGLAILPGSTNVVATFMDPVAVQTSGIAWLSNANGTRTKGYGVHTAAGGNSAYFGKSNGVGDVELLCDRAPIEIGNRVWNDDNSNGIQEADEAVYSGVTLELWADTNGDGTVDTQVGTAQTDANGEYYFVSSTAADADTTDNIGQINGGVLPNTAYQVRIPSSQFGSSGPLFNLLRSPANTDTTGNGDSRDSDGLLSAGNIVVNFTTAGSGSNNHTFDFGFYLPPTAATVPIGGRITASDGRGIRNVIVNLTMQDGTTLSARTGSFGYYRFDEIEVGQSVTVNVQAKRFSFKQPTVLVSIEDAVENLDFVAIE